MLRFAPLEPDPVLFDPTQTGDFASELAEAARQEQVPPWCSWIASRGEAPVAMGGFEGPPAPDGTVEIGYLTLTDHQGQGFATALAARDASLRLNVPAARAAPSGRRSCA